VNYYLYVTKSNQIGDWTLLLTMNY